MQFPKIIHTSITTLKIRKKSLFDNERVNIFNENPAAKTANPSHCKKSGRNYTHKPVEKSSCENTRTSFILYGRIGQQKFLILINTEKSRLAIATLPASFNFPIWTKKADVVWRKPKRSSIPTRSVTCIYILLVRVYGPAKRTFRRVSVCDRS